MAACPDCGIDESRIGVPDGIAALRGFPRRYRRAASAAGEAHESAVARQEIAVFATELQAGVDELAAALGHRAPGPVTGRDLAALEAVSEAAAVLADGVPWEAWDRPAPKGGRTAREILARLAHLGAHHLRAIHRVVPEADA